MKKYIKPMLYIEKFEPNQFVANCNVIITEKDKNDAMSCINPKHMEGPFYNRQHKGGESRVENVFTTKPVCGTLIQKGSPFTTTTFGLYTSDSVVYIFNDDNSHALSKNPICYNSDDEDRCYGAFKNPNETITGTTVVPVS